MEKEAESHRLMKSNGNNSNVKILKGADNICQFIKEDPKRINELVKCEGLPAWKRSDTGTWRALDIDLYQWMIFQRKKYLKDTPKYIVNT